MEGDEDALRTLARLRIADIKHGMADPNSVEYIYFLMEPDEDVIRYVGSCKKPVERFRSHINGSCGSRVAKWIASLKERGTLPRMKVVASVGVFGPNRASPVCGWYLGGLLEKGVIRSIALNRWYANEPYPASLLNVHGMPKKILHTGLDAGKDRV